MEEELVVSQEPLITSMVGWKAVNNGRNAGGEAANAPVPFESACLAFLIAEMHITCGLSFPCVSSGYFHEECQHHVGLQSKRSSLNPFAWPT